MKRWIFVLPVLAFLVIAGFLYSGLQRSKVVAYNELPSTLIGKPVPKTVLPPLDAQTEGFGPEDFTKGKVILVNVFSSTCVPCRLEAPILDRLAKMPGITIYGFAWKDKPGDARQFLNEVGNPFQRIGQDVSGRLGVEWGIYGWPATYLIDGHGIIRDMIWGQVTDQSVKNRLLPEIEKAQQGS
jgi:cytochrome c biogenesis protein CcmG/thiol:disulfide interchange protein DsbE